ncbi:MAG: DUF6289 family protein [Asticcacaulis sp.]|nr:DUF6289 family protein [Asticcacaulis sp.]
MKLFKTAALAVAVSMVGLAVVGDAIALPVEQYVYTYYSDASHSNEVGYKWLLCGGEHGTTGTITAYYTVEKFNCDGCNSNTYPIC